MLGLGPGPLQVPVPAAAVEWLPLLVGGAVLVAGLLGLGLATRARPPAEAAGEERPARMAA